MNRVNSDILLLWRSVKHD